MLSEETKTTLFKLAFQYKKTKLWQLLVDRQLFGVRLADGQTGYCCVMGNNLEHVALAVYVGQTGLSSLVDVAHCQMYPPEDSEFSILLGFEQNCVQCIYDDEYATEEQIDEATEYADKLGAKLRGPFTYPHFDRFVPMDRPMPVDNEADADVLIRGLRAAIHVAKALRAKAKPGVTPLRIPWVNGPGDLLPVFERNGAGRYSVSNEAVPDYTLPAISSPDPVDEFTAARMKKLPRDKSWDCTLAFMAGVTIEEDPSCMPAIPFVRQSETGMILPAACTGHYPQDLNRIYRNFVNCVIQNGTRPTQIRVHECDRRGKAFFSVFAGQLGIPLTVKNHLPELNEDLANFQSMDEPDDMIQEALDYISTFMEDLTFEELCQLSYPAQIMAAGLIECNHPDVSPELRDRILRAMEYWDMPPRP